MREHVCHGLVEVSIEGHAILHSEALDQGRGEDHLGELEGIFGGSVELKGRGEAVQGSGTEQKKRGKEETRGDVGGWMGDRCNAYDD